MADSSSQVLQVSQLLPPPAVPTGLDRSWEAIEKELGTPLPADYKAFTDRYGSGLVCGLIAVWNLRDKSLYNGSPLREILCGQGSVIQEYERVRARGNYSWPYAMYPEPGGLLPFATVIDVHHVNWLTEGSPDNWDIVFWFSDGQEFLHLKGESFMQFLLKLLRQEYAQNEIPKFDPPFEFTDFSEW